MSDIITIHEFSTGIEAEQTADGRWISRGFAGKWMNSTLNEEIPKPVQKAIDNKEFEARCFDNSIPAIIARVVGDNDEDYWSVVAVITIGADESRGFNAYRYFLCQGKDNLCVIIGWLRDKRNMPVFNPLQPGEASPITSQIAEKYIKSATDIDREIEIKLNNDSKLRDSYSQEPPILVKEGQYNSNLQVFDRLSHKIAQYHNYAVSWAYNVEALEKPEKFLIIQPATKEAYTRFKSIERSHIVYSPTTNENELKSAIQDLAATKDIKENLKIIEKNLEQLKTANLEKVNAFFNKLFETWGATKVIQEKTYAFNMLEIITLKAILLPDTLIEYLFYAEISNHKGGKLFSSRDNSKIKEQAVNFLRRLRREIQSISGDLPNIKHKLTDGLLKTLEKFFEDNNRISLETLIWLAGDIDSVWHLGKQELIEIIKSDLRQINEFRRVNQLGQLRKNNPIIKSYIITNNLINLYWFYKRPIPSYEPLSNFFLAINDYELAHYFYVISLGKFNNRIIENLPTDKQDIFGISIHRRTTNRTVIVDNSAEYSTMFINIILSLIIFIFLLISVAIKPINWTSTVIVIIAGVFIFIYATETQTQGFVNKYSLPIIMFALLLGNFSNLDYSPNFTGQKPPSTQPTPNQQINTQTREPSESPNVNNIDPNILNNAVKVFLTKNKTKDAIEQIIKNLIKKYPYLTRNDVITALKSVLEIRDENFSYASVLKNDKTQLEQLIKYIYDYQQNRGILSNNGLPDAIIEIVPAEQSQRTMNVLQEDIEQELINTRKIE